MLIGKRKCSRHLGIAILIARHRCFNDSSRHRRLKKAPDRFLNFATLVFCLLYKAVSIAIMARSEH